MAKVYVVRHAESILPGNIWCDGSAPLSHQGRSQTIRAAEQLKCRGVTPDVIDHALSPRSEEMARLLAGYAGWLADIRPQSNLSHRRKVDGGIEHVRLGELERNQRIWLGSLGINTIGVAVTSKRSTEALLRSYLDLDPEQIDQPGGTLHLQPGSIIRIDVARRGRIVDVESYNGPFMTVDGERVA